MEHPRGCAERRLLRQIMKLNRPEYDPGTLLDFYLGALHHTGAVCERSWFDRLQVLAEGRSAQIWNNDGSMVEMELRFPPLDSTDARDAERDVFPGSPLTFRLVELLRPRPLVLERVVLKSEEAARAPSLAVAEKLWHAQWPGSSRWRLETAFVPSWHFSLLMLVRCEIQAIDQHWSLHRMAWSLADGTADPDLEESFMFASADPAAACGVEAWPEVTPNNAVSLLSARISEEIGPDLEMIRLRQERYLQREVGRVDAYFENYERELAERVRRTHTEATRLKADERLAAARAEHARRRADQVQRHEIRVIPHVDAMLFVAEPAWRATVGVAERSEFKARPMNFVPRARRWEAVSVKS